MLKIKKSELVKVIQDLQAELRPRLLNPYQVCPNDKPWLENEAYINAETFLDTLIHKHTHCFQKGHACIICCECFPNSFVNESWAKFNE